MIYRIALVLLLALVMSACKRGSSDVVNGIQPLQPQVTVQATPSAQHHEESVSDTLEAVESTPSEIDLIQSGGGDSRENPQPNQPDIESSSPVVLVDKFRELRRFGSGSFSVIGVRPDGSVGSKLAIGGSLGILIFDTNSLELERVIPTITPNVVVWSPDGRYLASGSSRGIAQVWDAHSGRPQTTYFHSPSDQVIGIAWSPDGSTLTSSAAGPSREEWIPVWDARSGFGTSGNISVGCCFGGLTRSQDKQGRYLAGLRGAEGRADVVDLMTEDIISVHVPDYFSVGHKVVWSPVNTDLAILGNDDEGGFVLLVWSASSGQTRVVLRGSQFPGDIAWSPDGQRLAISAVDWQEGLDNHWTSIVLVSDGKVELELEACCRNIAWSTDGSKLIGIAYDAYSGQEVIRLTDTVSGQMLSEFVASSITEVAWSTVDAQLITLDFSGVQTLWDVNSGHPIENFRSSNRGIVSPDSERSAVAIGDQIHIHNVKTGKEILVLRDRANAIESLAWSPDGTLLASGDNSFGRVRIWNSHDGELLQTLEDPEDPDRNRVGLTMISDLKWLSAGRWLAAATPSAVQVWDSATWQLTLSFRQPYDWSPSERWLVVASPPELQIWDTATWELAHSMIIEEDFNEKDYQISWSPTERWLAITRLEALEIWDTRNWRLSRSFNRQDVGPSSVWFGPSAVWSLEGTQMASIKGDVVNIWHINSEADVQRFTIPQYNLVVRSWSPDNRFLLATHDRFSTVSPLEAGTIYVIDTVDKHIVGSLSGHVSSVDGFTWSPTGKYLVTVGSDGSARIWGVSLSEPAESSGQHSDPAQSRNDAQILPDIGKAVRIPELGNIDWIAIVGLDGNLWLIDPVTEEQLQVTRFRSERVVTPAWSRDGQKLAFGLQLSYTEADLLVIDFDSGSTLRLLTPQTGLSRYVAKVSDPAWTADGTWVYYSQTSDPLGRAVGLRRIRSSGRGRVEVPVISRGWFFEGFPAFSPDGRQMTYAMIQASTIVPQPLENSAIWLDHFDGLDGGYGHQHILGVVGKTAWSPNGKTIAYDAQLASGSAGSGIHLSSHNDSQSLRLIPDGEHPTWSPDGERIAYMKRKSQDIYSSEIWIMNADGTGERKLGDGAWPDWRPLFSGTAFRTSSPVADEDTIFVLPTPTPTPILPTPTPKPATPTPIPTDSPASVMITPDVVSPGPSFPAGATRISEKDGMEIVFVPAGDFLMGSSAGDTMAWQDEKPQHTVYLDAYWIDKTEVTVAQYRQCVEFGVCSAPSADARCTYGLAGMSDHPVNCVDWHQASSYCAWVNRRLPTEAEWEKAARGTDGRAYPWGDRKPDSTLTNFNQIIGRTTPVGSFPDGASPYGVLDMAGNVWEWVEDWYDHYPVQSLRKNPLGPTSGDRRVWRGGSWADSEYPVRSAFRGWASGLPDGYVDRGFRCAANAVSE